MPPVLRDIFMASCDLFNTRNGLLAILAGDLARLLEFGVAIGKSMPTLHARETMDGGAWSRL
jgi:hypothetical protein